MNAVGQRRRRRHRRRRRARDRRRRRGAPDRIAFEHDGTFKWLSPVDRDARAGAGRPWPTSTATGSPRSSSAGRSSTATARSAGRAPAGRGVDGIGPLSLVADLDLDGAPEVVAGQHGLPRRTAAIYWRTRPRRDGFPAVGNFDADPFPEVVLVGGGSVWLLEHDGAVKWGPVAIPGAAAAGRPPWPTSTATASPRSAWPAPAATSSSRRRHASSGRRRSRTAAPTSPARRSSTSRATARPRSSTRDERTCASTAAPTARCSSRRRMGSCTAYEYPVVADVDGDGNAEIVARRQRHAAAPAPPRHLRLRRRRRRWVRRGRSGTSTPTTSPTSTTTARSPRHEAPSWLDPQQLPPERAHRRVCLRPARRDRVLRQGRRARAPTSR